MTGEEGWSHTRRHGRVRDLSRRRGTAGDERHHVSVLAQPTMPGHLEQIGSLPWIGHEDSTQEVAGVRGHVFGKGEWSRDDVFIEEVDVVALRVGGIIVERQISSEHSILEKKEKKTPPRSSAGKEGGKEETLAGPKIRGGPLKAGSSFSPDGIWRERSRGRGVVGGR